MSAIKTRPASRADAAVLSDIHHASFAPAWNEGAMLSLLQHGALAWLASRAAKDVGFAMVRMAADEAEILGIAVLPDARQQGIGAKLLECACRDTQRAGAKIMFLEVADDNFSACRLYEKNGFTRIGTRAGYYANGADALAFRRHLG